METTQSFFSYPLLEVSIQREIGCRWESSEIPGLKIHEVNIISLCWCLHYVNGYHHDRNKWKLVYMTCHIRFVTVKITFIQIGISHTQITYGDVINLSNVHEYTTLLDGIKLLDLYVTCFIKKNYGRCHMRNPFPAAIGYFENYLYFLVSKFLLCR